jgi:hypothetical protein
MIGQLSAKALSRVCPRQEGQSHVTVGGTDRLYQARFHGVACWSCLRYLVAVIHPDCPHSDGHHCMIRLSTG